MADPQTPNKLLFTPAHNADINTWDVPMNANYNGLDQALGTYTALNATGLSGTIALTTSQTIPLGFIITGTPTGPINYQTPAGQGGIWLVRNRATLGASVTLGFSSASGGSTVTIPAATNLAISADGTASGMVDINTKASLPGGSNTQVQVNIAGVLGGYAGFTFDGTTLDVPNAVVSGNETVGGTLGVTGLITASSGIEFSDATVQTTAPNPKIIASANISAVANYALTGLSTTYNTLEIYFDLLPVTSGVALQVTLYDSVGTEITTASYGFVIAASNSSGGALVGGTAGALQTSGFLTFSGGVSNDASTGGVSGQVILSGMQSNRVKRMASTAAVWVNGVAEAGQNISVNTVQTTSTISGFKLKFSSGNIALGTVRVVGIVQ